MICSGWYPILTIELLHTVMFSEIGDACCSVILRCLGRLVPRLGSFILKDDLRSNPSQLY